MRVGTFYRAALLRSLGLDGARGRVLDVGGYDGFWLSALPAERRISSAYAGVIHEVMAA